MSKISSLVLTCFALASITAFSNSAKAQCFSLANFTCFGTYGYQSPCEFTACDFEGGNWVCHLNRELKLFDGNYNGYETPPDPAKPSFTTFNSTAVVCLKQRPCSGCNEDDVCQNNGGAYTPYITHYSIVGVNVCNEP